METSLNKASQDFNSPRVQNVSELLHPSLAELESIIYRKAMEWARSTYRAILECLDDEIKKRRHKSLAIVRIDQTWHTTMLGSVRVKRRYYRAPCGTYHYLLDELLGITKHCHISHHAQKLALEMAARMPFRQSSQVISKTTPVMLSHQTIHRIVERVVASCLDQQDKAVDWFKNTGELGWGKNHNTAQLLIEADGVMLPLQREGSRKVEAKLGISYEGRQKVGRDRYRTVNKLVHADIKGSDSFWSAMTLKIGRHYDLAGISHTVLGGDGAGWIRQGADYFGASYRLCQFHLNRNLTRTLGHDRQSLKAVKEALWKRDMPGVINLLDELAASTRGDNRKGIIRLAGYIKANIEGITIHPGPGTGAIEGNIDKIIVRRMKNQGMSWSIKGARHMLWLRVALYEDRLDDYLHPVMPALKPHKLPERTVRKVIDKKINQDYSDYFAAGVPALTGPHASRPWVKVLKSIAGGL